MALDLIKSRRNVDYSFKRAIERSRSRRDTPRIRSIAVPKISLSQS